MLGLSALNSLLSQVLQPPELHTAILLTEAGQLISFVTQSHRPKDEIHLLVGLSGEVWQETRGQVPGKLDSELGKLLVMPIDGELDGPVPEDYHPLMLLALNADNSVGWDDLESKGEVVARLLAQPLIKFRDVLVKTTVPSPTPVMSPSTTR